MEQLDALVIGGGPAGLMAAEALAAAGRRVTVIEAKPSFARKFLMAGKSGLNITKDESLSDFTTQFDSDWLQPMLAEFGPEQVMSWCRNLGQEVFSGSSGRVFPVTMKGSPLLRAWLQRLAGQGGDLRLRWRWHGWQDGAFVFLTPSGLQLLQPRVTVLALGGASWPRLGADGAWQPWLLDHGVEITPFSPANMGFLVTWSPHMSRHFGAPIKGAMLMAGTQRERGEFVISSQGLEGGGIYAVSRHLRLGAALTVDFMPDVSAENLSQRLTKLRAGETLANRLRKLGLSPQAAALVLEFGRHLPLLQGIKALPITHAGPRPLSEAISVAGGITKNSLTEGLELKSLPRVFACGEMLDWEAPTGGYLLTACWATGLWAGRHAAKYL